MDHVADLPAKLESMLKAASLSRVALAQRLGVDKSLVSRWLSGAVHPTEHNLARLSSLMAEHFPGFRLADWYGTAGELARRHGVEPSPRPTLETARPMPGVLAAFLEAARPELEHRGAAYTGFWRTSRPSLLMGGKVFHDYGMIQRSGDGLIDVRMEGVGLDFSGWLFPIAGNIFTFLFDSTGRTPMLVMFKGVSLPKAALLDGILTMAALDPGRTPVAMPIVVERVGDLSGDDQADLARFREILAASPDPIEPLGQAELEARLFRDTGPSAAARGGEPFLAVSAAASLSRGVSASGLAG